MFFNPVFKGSKNLLSSWVDKVTTGTYSFFFFIILKVAPVEALISILGGLELGSASYIVSSVLTTFSYQAKVKDTSQLINGMFRVLQKLLRCFSGRENSTETFLLLAVFLMMLVLNL